MFEHVRWNLWPLKNLADRPGQTWHCASRPRVVILEQNMNTCNMCAWPVSTCWEVPQGTVSPVQIAFGKTGAVSKQSATCHVCFFVNICFVSALLQGADCQSFWGHLRKHCYVSWNVVWVIAGSLQMIVAVPGLDVMNPSMQVHLAITFFFFIISISL